jgi:hypothetical protein
MGLGPRSIMAGILGMRRYVLQFVLSVSRFTARHEVAVWKPRK